MQIALVFWKIEDEEERGGLVTEKKMWEMFGEGKINELSETRADKLAIKQEGLEWSYEGGGGA